LADETHETQSLHPATEALLQYFRYEHLLENLQAISKPIAELAEGLAYRPPQNPEVSARLRKLLEAKDCFVRAAL
jgi:hypothetical protein